MPMSCGANPTLLEKSRGQAWLGSLVGWSVEGGGGSVFFLAVGGGWRVVGGGL